jgi:hypothetical protein
MVSKTSMLPLVRADIGLVIVRMVSFPARESGQRARMAVRWARPGEELVMTAHRTHPPTRAMRENPDIDQLKRQAKELLEAYRAQSPDAVIEVAAHHRTATPETFALHDAQFELARSYGFESWPKLKAAVDGVTTTRLHEAVQNGDLAAVRALLARRPEIVDLLRGGPSGFEIRALQIAVMKRAARDPRAIRRDRIASSHGGLTRPRLPSPLARARCRCAHHSRITARFGDLGRLPDTDGRAPRITNTQ